MAEVYVALNLKTGVEHTVPEGHFSFRDPSYEILGLASEVYASREEEKEESTSSHGDFESLSTKELKELAKERDIQNYWLMKRATLLEALAGQDEEE